MSNLTITQNNTAGVVLWDPQYRSEAVTFAAAGTLKVGTLLARDTSTLKLVPFVTGGTTAGNGVANCVLIEELTATAAGDLQTRALVSGSVRQDMLVISADGDASNVTAAVVDQLRDMTIIAKTTTQLAMQDNV